jgi:hypothetical protein
MTSDHSLTEQDDGESPNVGELSPVENAASPNVETTRSSPRASPEPRQNNAPDIYYSSAPSPRNPQYGQIPFETRQPNQAMTRQPPYGQPPFYDNRGAYGPPQYQEPYYQPYLMDIHQMQPNAWPPYGGPDARAHKEFQGYYQPHSMAQGYYENPHPINQLWVPPHMRQIVN